MTFVRGIFFFIFVIGHWQMTSLSKLHDKVWLGGANGSKALLERQHSHPGWIYSDRIKRARHLRRRLMSTHLCLPSFTLCFCDNTYTNSMHMKKLFLPVLYHLLSRFFLVNANDGLLFWCLKMGHSRSLFLLSFVLPIEMTVNKCSI